MTATPSKSLGIAAASFGRDSVPVRDGPHLGMLDDEHVARVQEHRRRASLPSSCSKNAAICRADHISPYPETRSRLRLRCRAHERQRLQDALDVREVLSNAAMIGFAPAAPSSSTLAFSCRARSASSVASTGCASRRLLDEPEQLVRDALHRRDDDGQVVAAALAADDAGHAANTARVGNARAAELVHSPSHDSILWGSGFRRPRA